ASCCCCCCCCCSCVVGGAAPASSCAGAADVVKPTRTAPRPARQALTRFDGHVFGGVVRCFLRDGNIMGMVLPNRCGGNLNESRLGSQFSDCLDTEISHAGPQPPDQLVEEAA